MTRKSVPLLSNTNSKFFLRLSFPQIGVELGINVNGSVVVVVDRHNSGQADDGKQSKDKKDQVVKKWNFLAFNLVE